MTLRLGRQTGSVVRIFRKLVSGVWRLCTTCCTTVLGCCNSSQTPLTLTLHVPGNPLDGVSVSIPLSGGTPDIWQNPSADLTSPCDGPINDKYLVTLLCLSSVYSLTIRAAVSNAGSCAFSVLTTTTVSCSPLHLQGTGTIFGGGSSGCQIFCSIGVGGTSFTYDIV